MTQAILNPKEGVTILAVVVPNNAYDFRISMTGLIYYVPKEMNATKHYDIREGEIIGLISELTEEQAKELFDWKDFLFVSERAKKLWGSALERLEEVLASYNIYMTPEQDVLLIKVN